MVLELEIKFLVKIKKVKLETGKKRHGKKAMDIVFACAM